MFEIKMWHEGGEWLVSTSDEIHAFEDYCDAAQCVIEALDDFSAEVRNG